MSKIEKPLFALLDIGDAVQQCNKESEKRLGISLTQWCLLKHLIDMPSASAQSLALEIEVHPSTLTQMLKRLERKRFIFIVEDPKDSRKKLISITRSGKEILERSTSDMENWFKDLIPLTDDLHRMHDKIQKRILK